MKNWILLIIILPIVLGVGLLTVPERVFAKRKMLCIAAGACMVLCGALAVLTLCGVGSDTLLLFRLVDDIPIYFALDGLGRLFVGIVTLIFLLAGFFSFSYMAHEKKEKRYYAFYLMTYGILLGLGCAGNLVTLYLFYEIMTLVSMPLVIHTETHEAVMAALKYLFYSFCGAYMALFGIYCLYQYADTLDFVAGGTLQIEPLAQSGNTVLMQIAAFFIILGFGVKAGSFPMHAWLPTAHPVAPAPASAFLSGIIVKGGILAVIRAVYYCIGTTFLRGTWVQTVWLSLAIITIVMGSALAYKEKILKKRLAYSTVSNLSYIMLGLAVMTPDAFTGSLLHMVFHAIIKCALFLFAGAVIFTTGETKVSGYAGLGRKMPVLFWCYTIASLGLIGIPPTSGLQSKWYLAVGSLKAGAAGNVFSAEALGEGIGVFAWLAPVALLLSALLTAGYLLPISIQGFLGAQENGLEGDKRQKQKADKKLSYFMLVPMVILAVLTVVLGVYPFYTPLIEFIRSFSTGLM